MGSVENDCRTLKSGGKLLEASRPIGHAGAASDAFGSDAEPESGKLLGGGDSQREIAELMAAYKRRNNFHLLAKNVQLKSCFYCGAVNESGSLRRRQSHVADGADRMRTKVRDALAENPIDLGMLRQCDSHYLGAEDTRFLPGNLSNVSPRKY